MAGFENLKNEELETSKLRLLDMKHMIKEIQGKTQQLRKEHESSCTQHQKKMKNLNNLEATQCLKLTKLDSDIASVEQVLSSRVAEQKSLVKLIESNKKAIKSTAEETETMIVDFHKKCHDLEENIKESYLHIQTDEDMEVLVEMAHNYFKDGHKLSLLYDILCAKREAIFKRRQDIKKEFSRIEAFQTAMNLEMKAKKEDLAKARELYSILATRYASLKSLKKGYFADTDSCPSNSDSQP